MKSVRISRIDITDLGPVRRFSAELGDLNVIYGRNEQGKTWIVEFLIRSLFSISRKWGLRNLTGNGRITVTGLEQEPVDFSLSSPKIEEFLGESAELPGDFSRLLVVKAGELTLMDPDSGSCKIDKQTLKHFLSNQSLLDRIENRISANLRRSSFTDGLIIGNKAGEIKRREELFERVQKIDRLFDQISKGYSGGHRKTLSMKIDDLMQAREALLQAKRHRAWNIARTLRTLENEIETLDHETMNTLGEQIRIFQVNEDQLKHLRHEAEQSAHKSRHYAWLKNAHELYLSRLQRLPSKPAVYLLAIPVFFILAAGACIWLDRTIPAAVSLLMALTGGVLYFLKLNQALSRQPDQEERRLFSNDFETRFRLPFSGLTQLETLLEERRDAHVHTQVLNQQVSEKESELERLRLQISQRWSQWMQTQVPEEKWIQVLTEKQTHWSHLQQKKQQQREELIGLQIDPQDTLDQDPGVEFNQTRLYEINGEIEAVTREYQDINQKLGVLKQYICQETGDSVDQAWETILLHLQETRDRVLSDYQDITAEIIGKLLVRRVIEQMRTAEDEKIVRGLSSAKLNEPLQKVTGRYKRLRLYEQDILVMDDTHEFPVSDLSTGTQEQVLLAFRLGFASRLFDQDRLFFILDDAFQHSDWQRREFLVDQFVALAADGWQILYFTMDDHIRDLFNQKGAVLGKRYLYKHLNQMNESDV